MLYNSNMKVNKKEDIHMKNLILALVIAIVLFTGFVFIGQTEEFYSRGVLNSAILAIAIAFAVTIVIKRFISYRKKEPAEDEMTKHIMQKSSSLSFYISLYLWLALSYFSSRLNLNSEELIGYGIAGMALIFAILILYYKLKGISDE